MTWEVRQGDCIESMAAMAPESVDAVVCDPPYGLSREPDIAEVLKHWLAGDDYEHRGGGFMGRSWDSFVPGPAYWQEAFRALKPGAHVVAFGGTRTSDLLTIALRFAGFEIRDSLAWIFGSGFPKSLDVSKAIDRAAGADRKVVGVNPHAAVRGAQKLVDGQSGGVGYRFGEDMALTASSTADAQRWDGWGTALKPAHEPIVLARKPLVGTVARNVLEYGTGGLNIDATRIAPVGVGDYDHKPFVGPGNNGELYGDYDHNEMPPPHASGRWPANVVLSHAEGCEEVGTKRVKGDPRGTGSGRREGGFADVGAASGSSEPNAKVYGDATVPEWRCVEGCPVAELDRQSGQSCSPASYERSTNPTNHVYGAETRLTGATMNGHGDTGGASRFFYCAKASRSERNAGLDGFERAVPGQLARGGDPAKRMGRTAEEGWDGRDQRPTANVHPTVKSIALMRWLCRLVTPGGLILDPFAGSGSTGCAAVLEGFDFIGLEREPEYVEIARARIAYWAERRPAEQLELGSAA